MVSVPVAAAKPEDLGIDSEKLEMVFARAKRDVDDGTLPSAQVAVARHGKLAGMRTYGSAVQGGVEKPATDDTLYHFFSSTKAVVSAAVWLLFEDGQLRLDEKVADIIPEFGTNGKDAIDVETLMLHAGGFPLAPFSRRNVDRPRGAAAGVQPVAAQLAGRQPVRVPRDVDALGAVGDHRAARRAAVEDASSASGCTDPMGLDELFIGCPPEQQHRVADVVYVTPSRCEPPGGWGEVTPEAILRFNEPERARGGRAGRRRRRVGGDDGAVLPAADQRRRDGGRHAHHDAGGDRVRDEGAGAAASHRPDDEARRSDAERQHEPRARRGGCRRRRVRGRIAASGARARRARSGTAAPAGRSPGAIRRRVSASATHERLRRCDGGGAAGVAISSLSVQVVGRLARESRPRA